VRLLRDGLGKLGRRPATWVTFGLLAGMMMLIFVAIGATANSLPSQPGQPGQPGAGAIRAILTFPQAYDAILAFIIGLGLLLAVIYGAAIAGSEWTWGTLKNAVARGESRAAYVALTFAAIAVMVGVGLVLAMVVGTGAAFVGASLAGIPTDGAANADALASLPVKLVRSWAGLAAAGAIGFAIATFTRSQLAGIGVGIGTFFGEQFSTIFFPDIVRWLPFNAAEAASGIRAPGGGGVGVSVGGEGPLAMTTLAPDVALVVVIAWLVGAVLASAAVAQRAEITG
jgi:ABC-2 type transport system permease protein